MNVLFDFTDKVVLITGGAGGIGFEIGRQFALSGGTVILSDKNIEKLDIAISKIKEINSKAVGLVCDVKDEEQVIKIVNEILDRHNRIDVLINNAGLQFIAPIDEFPTDRFELMIKVMLVAPFLMIKQVFPSMKKNLSGRIINISSINGLVGFSGKAAYNSAKHGLIGLTKVAALEGAPYNITANAICPGYVDTDLVRSQLASLAKSRNISVENVLEEVIFPLVPQKRLLSTEEIANYVLFLSEDSAKGITGQAIVIDGGYTAQ